MSLKRDAHFVSCNVNVSLSALNLPNVRAVCVQFPDPWSRGKHVERRVMTPDFAGALRPTFYTDHGELYCCSDVRALAEEMYDVVAANDDFKLDEDTYARVGETRHEDFDDASRRRRTAPEYGRGSTSTSGNRSPKSKKVPLNESRIGGGCARILRVLDGTRRRVRGQASTRVSIDDWLA